MAPGPSLRILLLAALLSGAGCAGERGASPRFYLLTPMAAPSAASAPAALDGAATIGIGPVRIPAYLDRPQIVTRRGREEIDLAEFDRWGEPVAEGLPRAIADNLAVLMPGENIALFPWAGSRPIRHRVLIDVTRFDGTPGGDVVLDARWRVLAADRQELVVRRSVLSEATGGPGYPALVAALSRSLAALSREIASALGSL
jgi:uncharacterized lipoprotein YmbA